MAGWMATVRPEPDADGVVWFELPCGDALASVPREQWETGEHVTRYCMAHEMTYGVVPVPGKYLNGISEHVVIVLVTEGSQAGNEHDA